MKCEWFSQLLQRSARVTAVSYVDTAREWARQLEDREAGASDRKTLRARLERRLGLPAGTLYSLRYRPPKAISAHVYEAIRAGFIATHEAERARLAHRIEVARAAGLGDRSLCLRPGLAALDMAAERAVAADQDGNQEEGK